MLFIHRMHSVTIFSNDEEYENTTMMDWLFMHSLISQQMIEKDGYTFILNNFFYKLFIEKFRGGKKPRC